MSMDERYHVSLAEFLTQTNSNDSPSLQTKFASYPQTDLEHIDPQILALLPENKIKKTQALPFAEENHVIHVAMMNPLSIESVDVIALSLKRPFKIFLAHRSLIETKINALCRKIHTAPQLAKLAAAQLSSDFNDLHMINQETGSDTSYIAQLLGTLIDDAITLGASDIHIEANDIQVAVRYRLGGALLKQAEFNVAIKEILIRHILSRSDGNISETQLPQDTAFVHRLSTGERINLRVSTLSSMEGYSIVMRLLKVQNFYSLQDAIRSPTLLEAIQRFIQQKNGMFIVTGPTCSGKTTMLYTILNTMTHTQYAEKKVISIEDPVEVMLPGITQVQVNTKIGLDFGDVIKVSLRQNPDVLMLGEIRDAISASMAMRASITGVMVLATLHTRDTADVVFRLHDLGIPLPMIGNSLKLIVSTRLLRMLCTRCKRPHHLTDEESLSVAPLFKKYSSAQASFFKAGGCSDCHHTGYRGLTPIYEFIALDKAHIAALSANNAEEFHRIAEQKLGDNTLLHGAFALWVKGVTSYTEVATLISSAEVIETPV